MQVQGLRGPAPGPAPAQGRLRGARLRVLLAPRAVGSMVSAETKEHLHTCLSTPRLCSETHNTLIRRCTAEGVWQREPHGLAPGEELLTWCWAHAEVEGDVCAECRAQCVCTWLCQGFCPETCSDI